MALSGAAHRQIPAAHARRIKKINSEIEHSMSAFGGKADIARSGLKKSPDRAGAKAEEQGGINSLA
jgi:hypothetical protein